MSPVLPISLKPPVIKRRHLRKYSWLPDVFRIKGSIIPRIVGPVLTVTIWAALVSYADYRGIKPLLTNSVLPLLSVVVGLMLVFRNGTSYDRFWEGRKSFASVTSMIRNFGRIIWVNVGMPPSGDQPVGIKGRTPVTSTTAQELRKRKEYTLKLALSFAYATRHYLRGEDGDHYADYQNVLPTSFRQWYSTHKGYASCTSLANSATLDEIDATKNWTPESSQISKRNNPTKRVRPKRSKCSLSAAGNSKTPTTPLLSGSTTESGMRFPNANMPFPMIIAHELARMVYLFRRDGFLETIGPAGLNSMSAIVQGLSDQLTVMERIANTPIPHSCL
jgi:ion channel-forming bestrophin family protein